MKLLVDKNIEGQAAALFTILQADGWVDLLGLELLHLEDVGLAYDDVDRIIWRTAQALGLLILTENRRRSGADSLQQTLEEETTLESLPCSPLGQRIASPPTGSIGGDAPNGSPRSSWTWAPIAAWADSSSRSETIQCASGCLGGQRHASMKTDCP